jgi:hypothetical protein
MESTNQTHWLALKELDGTIHDALMICEGRECALVNNKFRDALDEMQFRYMELKQYLDGDRRRALATYFLQSLPIQIQYANALQLIKDRYVEIVVDAIKEISEGKL